MPAPPFVRRRLRPPGRRILPLLLSSIGRNIQEAPNVSDCFAPALGREISAIDVLSMAQEDRQAMSLPFGLGHNEVRIEAVICARYPPMWPPHAISIVLV